MKHSNHPRIARAAWVAPHHWKNGFRLGGAQCALWLSAVVLTLVSTAALAQDLGLKAPPQREPISIVGAAIHPVAGPVIERGWITFEAGTITGLGEGQPPAPLRGRVIDGTGKHVYPGLIQPVTRMGLMELRSSTEPTSDAYELGDITPEVKAITAVNPDSTLLPVARANGILLAGVAPAGGLIPGRLSVCRLEGWTTEDLAVAPVAGLWINWPNLRPITAPWMRRSVEDQRKESAKALGRLRDLFERARAYLAARQADPSVATDHRHEALRAVFAPELSGLDRQVPVFAAAQDYEQITSAISFAREFGLRVVIVGGAEALLCADVLQTHRVPVILLGTHRLPRRADSDYDEAWRLPQQLQAAGVQWTLASTEMHGNDRNLPYHAAAAVAHGLDAAAALRAITLTAAEVLGVADRYGSLERGKSATLLVTDGSPLEITTHVEWAFLDGRQLDLANKQTRLRDKYTEKYRQRGEFTTDPAWAKPIPSR